MASGLCRRVDTSMSCSSRKAPLMHQRCLESKGTNLPQVSEPPEPGPYTVPFALPTECHRSRGLGLANEETGLTLSPMCKANYCPYCALVKRRKIALACGLSTPTHFLTVTHVGNDWETIHQRVNRLLEYMRRQCGPSVKWMFKVECNVPHDEEAWPLHPHHMHAYLHGQELPSGADVVALAERAKLGREAELIALDGDVLRIPKYVWGERKQHEIHPLNIDHHLAINGGRLEHHSNAFFRLDGQAFSSVSGILKANRKMQDPSENWIWTHLPPTGIPDGPWTWFQNYRDSPGLII